MAPITTVNGISIDNKTADLEIYDGTSNYGFLLGVPYMESRGSSFTGGGASGAQAYEDAEMFKRQAWENWGGGFGQVYQNRFVGGTGKGGDPSRFMFGNGWSLQGDNLMPGPRRTQVTNKGGATGSLMNTNSKMYETPWGVIPFNTQVAVKNPRVRLNTGTLAVTNIECLVYIPSKLWNDSTSYTLSVLIEETNVPGTILATYSASVVPSSYRPGFNWVRFTSGPGTTLTSSKDYNLKQDSQNNSRLFSFGACVNYGVAELYYRIIYTTTDALQTTYPLVFSGTMINVSGDPVTVCIGSNPTGTTLQVYNLTNTYSFTSTSERFNAALIFDNKLYIATTTRVLVFASGFIDGGSAPTAVAGTVLYAMIAHEGVIYAVGGDFTSIWRYDGVSTFTPVVAANKIGKANTNFKNPINNIIIHQGLLYVIKPEGVYLIYQNPGDISTATVPRVIQVLDLTDREYIYTGKFVVQMAGQIYFNYRHQLIRLNLQGDSPEQEILTPVLPLHRFSRNNVITGISTDSRILYLSYANVGVLAYNGQGWHMVTEFYRQTVDTQVNDTLQWPSGLKIITNTTYKYDQLVVGDQKDLLTLPLPDATQPYNRQLSMDDQNRCFYHISSVFDADLLDIPKYFHSMLLRAYNPNWAFKIAAITFDPFASDGVDFAGLAEDQVTIAPTYPSWKKAPQVGYNITPGLPLTGTHFDGFGDLNNSSAMAEKDASPNGTPWSDGLSSKAVIFAIYGYTNTWIPVTGVDQLARVDSFVLKYLSTQDYVPLYQNLKIDLHTTANNSGNATTIKGLMSFLRQAWSRQLPCQIRIRGLMGVGEDGSYIKTVAGFLQKPQLTYEPQATLGSGTSHLPAVWAKVDFLSMAAEYKGV